MVKLTQHTPIDIGSASGTGAATRSWGVRFIDVQDLALFKFLHHIFRHAVARINRLLIGIRM
jgi:hypothetical protein